MAVHTPTGGPFRPPRRPARAVGPVLAFATLLGAAPATAQDPDFLFGRPRGAVGIQVGWHAAAAESDMHDHARATTTLGDGDFDAPLLSADVAWMVGSRMEAALGVGYFRSAADSELRDWEWEDGAPIRQATRVTQAPLTATLRLHLAPQGREISSYAWIPSRWSPYVGVGAGVVRYRFVQEGDFVQESDAGIFEDHFEAAGWAPTAYGLLGMQVGVFSPRTALTVEARYAWGEGTPGGDYSGFDAIDLSGYQARAGLRLRF